MAKKKVLLIGIDPKLIDFSKTTFTEWDANRVLVAAQDALLAVGFGLECRFRSKCGSCYTMLDSK
jgi:hypothetical protein